MHKMEKFIFLNILLISSITIVNSAPCFTDNKIGCENENDTIYVITQKTTNGFCTEYINEDKKKVIRCHAAPFANNIRLGENYFDYDTPTRSNNGPIYNIPTQVQQTINYDYSTNTNNYNNGGYGDGYYSGYNYNPYIYRQYRRNNRHRPPHYDEERPKPNNKTVIGARPANQTSNTLGLGHVNQVNNNRPQHQESPSIHESRPNNSSRSSSGRSGGGFRSVKTNR